MKFAALGSITSVLAFVAGIASFAAAAQEDTRYDAPEPPPPALEEAMPGQPGPDYTWAAGHWTWEFGQYDWVGGEWIPSRPGYEWTPDRWVRGTDGLWHMQPGYWRNGR